MPQVSLIVPVLHDAAAAAGLLASLPPAPDLEILIVDGAQDPSMDEVVATRPDVRLLRTGAGRGHQMNVGAAAAGGRWLLFLHADSRLPGDWRTALAAADQDTAVNGGWFRFQLDAHGWQARVIERLVGWRTTVLRLPYGDQGLFVRRDIFTTLGGFLEIPLMEDVEFVRRLRRSGRQLPSALPVLTSARRWERDGWFLRSARNLALVGLYFGGVSPARLARWYAGR